MVHVRILVPVTSFIWNRADSPMPADPGVTLSYAHIPSGPPSIESRFDDAFSVPALLAAAMQAEREAVDALVIDCMSDPGLGALREAVGIPVLGAAQSGMMVAALLARRDGVGPVRGRTGTMIEDAVDRYGQERHYVGCAPIGVPVLRIHDDPAKVRAALAEAALGLVTERGAAAILLGCTAFTGCAEAVRARLLEAGYDVPVVDPVPTAVALAAALWRLGLSQSRVTYPPLAAKALVGFDHLFAPRPSG